MAIMSRLRNLRHSHFTRVRYQRRLIKFLAAQDTRLTSSATAQTVSTVNVSAVAATGTLTNDGTNVTDGDTVTIDGVVYTFQNTLTNVAGHIKIGASNTATMTNLFHGINATGGTAGTDYAAANTAHATVTASNPTGTTVVLTAKTASAAGNSIATTEASTHLSFGAATLTGGVTAAFGPTFTATGHGMTNGEGPYTLTSTGTVPAVVGPALGQVWVANISTNVIALARTREDAVRGHYITFSSAGTGTVSLTKSMTNQGIYEAMRRHRPETIVAATDVDALN